MGQYQEQVQGCVDFNHLSDDDSVGMFYQCLNGALPGGLIDVNYKNIDDPLGLIVALKNAADALETFINNYIYDTGAALFAHLIHSLVLKIITHLKKMNDDTK